MDKLNRSTAPAPHMHAKRATPNISYEPTATRPPTAAPTPATCIVHDELPPVLHASHHHLLLPAPHVVTPTTQTAAAEQASEVTDPPLNDLCCRDAFVSGMRRSVSHSMASQALHRRRGVDAALGTQYQPNAFVARQSWLTASSSTQQLCIMMCYRPSAWNEHSHHAQFADDGQQPGTHNGHTSLQKVYSWMSPRTLEGDVLRSLVTVASGYEAQFNSLVARKPNGQKPSLDCYRLVNAKAEDVTSSLRQLRQSAGPGGRIILHYSGHGVSRPRGNYIFLQGSSTGGDGVKYTLDALRSNAQYPMILIADCPSAGAILNNFLEAHRREEDQQSLRYRSSQAAATQGTTQPGVSTGMVQAPSNLGMHGSSSGLELDSSDNSGRTSARGHHQRGLVRATSLSGVASPILSNVNAPQFNAPPSVVTVRDDFFFIGACVDGDALPSHALLPNDIMTACVTSPIKMSLLWYVASHRSLVDLHPVIIHLLPGMAEDKKSPLGQLKWAFESYADSIAWATLPADTFARLFRQDLTLANVFRGYLLAHRLVSSFLNGNIVVYPPMPPATHANELWLNWDFQVEKAVFALHRAVRPLPSRGLASHDFREFLDVNSMRLLVPIDTATPGYLALLQQLSEESAGHPLMMSPQSQGPQGLPVASPPRREPSTPSFPSNAPTSQTTNPTEWLLPRNPVDFQPQTNFLDEELRTIDRILERMIDHGFYGYRTGGGREPLPLLERLPILFQGVLVLAHREESIRLMCRFFDMGADAVIQGIELNMFTQLRALFRHPMSVGHRMALLFIFCKAVYVDPSVVSDEVFKKELINVALEYMQSPLPAAKLRQQYPTQTWQLHTLRQFALPSGQVALAATMIALLSAHLPQNRILLNSMNVFDVCASVIAERCCPPGSQTESTYETDLSSPSGLSEMEIVDVTVTMQLTLLASLSCLVVGLVVIPDSSTDADAAPPPAGAMLCSAFLSAIDRCTTALAHLLSSEHPSVRLAATRTIAAIVMHPVLSDLAPGLRRADPARPHAASVMSSATVSSEGTTSDNAPPLTVDSVAVRLLAAVLARCETSLPMEGCTDVRLEQLGLMCSVLLRHGKSLMDRLNMDTIKLCFSASTVTFGGRQTSASNRNSKRDSQFFGHSDPLLAANAVTMMSPFALPSQVPVAATTMLPSGLESDDDTLSPSQPLSPSPFADSVKPRATPPSTYRIHRSMNKWCREALHFLSQNHTTTSSAFSTPPSKPLPFPIPLPAVDIVTEGAAVLCSALKHLLVCSTDTCAVIRSHASKAVERITAAQIIRNMDAFAGTSTFGAHPSFSSVNYRGSLDGRDGGFGTTAGSRRRFAGFLSIFNRSAGTKGTPVVASRGGLRRESTKSKFMASAVGGGGGGQSHRDMEGTAPPLVTYRNDADWSDPEEDDALRMLSHSDPSAVCCIAYAATAFLSEINLVALDDHDPRHPMQELLRHELRQFGKEVGAILESHQYSLSTTRREGDEVRFLSVLDKEQAFPEAAAASSVDGNARALAFHPTERLILVASNGDVLSVVGYDDVADEQQLRFRHYTSFQASQLQRRWIPRPRSGCTLVPPLPFFNSSDAAGDMITAAKLYTGEDSQSEFDVQSDGPQTPHSHTRSMRDRDQPPGSSGVSFVTPSGVSGSEVPVGDVCWLDAYRSTPMVSAVHCNGAISLFALDLDSITAAAEEAIEGVGGRGGLEGGKRGKRGDAANAPERSIIRVSTFHTMPQEQRANAFQCVASYHPPAQQMHVALAADGTVSTWDLTSEQLVGLHGGGYLTSLHTRNISSLADERSLPPYASVNTAHPVKGPQRGHTALGSHTVDPFRFLVGQECVCLYDSRCRRPQARFEGVEQLPWCLSVSFSMRYEHLITAGFSGAYSLVAAWDDRQPASPVFLYSPDKNPKPQGTPSQQGSLSSAQFISVHPALPDMVVAVATASQLTFTENGEQAHTSRHRVKQPTACVFHPLRPVCGVLSHGNRLQLFSSEIFSTAIAHEVARF